MKAEVDAARFAAADDFPLRHRELVRLKVPQFAEPPLHLEAKVIKVDLSRRQSDHKL